MKNLFLLSILTVGTFASNLVKADYNVFDSYLSKGYCISAPRTSDEVKYRTSGSSCEARVTLQKQINQGDDNQPIGSFESVEASSYERGFNGDDAHALKSISSITIILPLITTTVESLVDAAAADEACDELEDQVEQLYATGRICR